jgi:hypothetical protein
LILQQVKNIGRIAGLGNGKRLPLPSSVDKGRIPAWAAVAARSNNAAPMAIKTFCIVFAPNAVWSISWIIPKNSEAIG